MLFKNGKLIYTELHNINYSYRNQYWKIFIFINSIRLIALFGIMLEIYLLNNYIYYGNSGYIIPTILIFIAIILLCSLSELEYIKAGRNVRPIHIFENGLLLPPIYLDCLRQSKGFIKYIEIKEINIVRISIISENESKNVVYLWRNAPGYINIILNNGKKKKCYKTPTRIKAISDELLKMGFQVNDDGVGTGTEIIYENKIIRETRTI